MAKPLVFLGCNTAMQLLVDAAHRQGLTVAGIVDSDYYGNTETFAKLMIIGSEKEFDDPIRLSYWINNYDFFIGTNWSPDAAHERDRNKRQYLINLIEKHNITCISLIDPQCYIGSNVKIGQGCYIAYNTYIEFDNEIGDFCLIHFNTGLSYGCRIGNNTIIRQRSGTAYVDIGDNVYIGTGSSIFTSSKRLTVGNNAIINQGLWVMRNVAENEHVKLTKNAIRITKAQVEI